MSRPLKARLGWAGYADILACVKREPGTIKRIAENAGVGRDTIYRLIPDMHASGLLHISGWSQNPGEQTLAVYAYGPGADAQPPAKRPNGRPVNSARVLRNDRISPEIIAFRTLMRTIEVPSTVNEIVAACGCHRDTARSALARLMVGGIARIDHYAQRHGCGGMYVANYVLGSGRNACRPDPRKLRAATAQRWRDRVKRTSAAAPLLQAFGMPVTPRAIGA